MRKPIHPPLTDFPIALWTMSVAFDIASFWYGAMFVQLAFWNMAAGLVLAVFTALFGIRDYSHLPQPSEVRKAGLVHALFAVLATVIFAVNIWFRTFQMDALRTPTGALVLSLVGLVMLAVAGNLGGRLVFRHGANVQPVRSSALTFDEAEAERTRPYREFRQPKDGPEPRDPTLHS